VAVQHFFENWQQHLAEMSQQILAGSLELGRFREFEVRDPKPRTIHAPHFAERVFHHALMAHVGPVLERQLGDHTFACRVGKGAHAAVRQARALGRRFGWFGQLDLRGYFASIPHARLLQLLARCIKGRAVLALLERAVATFSVALPGEPGRGLPIGTLPSQHLANFYLASADRFLLERARVGGMVRYMDDFTWWGHTRHDVKAALVGVRAQLHEDLQLQCHRERLAPVSQGVALLGFRLRGQLLLPSRRRLRRYRAARALIERQWEQGALSTTALQWRHDCAAAILAHTQSEHVRRRHLAARPPVDA
jgi:hypothetical protein